MSLFYCVLRKQWLLSSYSKGALFFRLVAVIFNCFLFYGVSTFVSMGDGESYASYVLPALGGVELMTAFLLSSRQYLEEATQQGLLPMIAGSTFNTLTIMACENLWPALVSLIDLLLYLTVAAFLTRTSNFTALAAWGPRLGYVAASFLLLATQFWFFGLISAGIFLCFRRGSSINHLTVLALSLLSGVYFPVTRLPVWLARLAQVDALSVFNDALRGELSARRLGIAALITPLVVGLSLSVYWALYRRARREGGLTL